MHWGAKLGKKEMIRMAVKGGVDVNMRTVSLASPNTCYQSYLQIWTFPAPG